MLNVTKFMFFLEYFLIYIFSVIQNTILFTMISGEQKIKFSVESS